MDVKVQARAGEMGGKSSRIDAVQRENIMETRTGRIQQQMKDHDCLLSPNSGKTKSGNVLQMVYCCVHFRNL